MVEIALNVFVTSLLISGVLWISKVNPTLAGFIASLPISTLIILALSKIQNGATENTFNLAKSIFIGVPSTLLFFLPFLFAERFKLNFWSSYILGFILLGVSYGIHRWMMNHWMN